MTSNDKILTAEEILAADDYVQETVPVPEWGGSVIVKGLTGTERDAYESSILRARKDGNLVPNLANARAKLAVMTVIGEDRKPIFNNEEHLIMLGRKSAKAMNRVFEVAQRLAGLRDEDIEELLGNSEAVQSEGSTSG